jgi:hypothetical protein
MPLILTLYFAASTPGCHRVPVMYFKGTFYQNYDVTFLRKNEKECAEAYPKSPCVNYMVKIAHLTYRVSCGGK